MLKLVSSLSMVALLLVMVVASAAAAPGVQDAQALKDLAQVRQATARYHDVAAAIADGYVPIGECVEVPGLGAMGIHFLNPGLAGDLEVDLVQPELLLYVPSGEGLRLVGVEYFVAALANSDNGPMPWFGHEPPESGWFNLAPELFGRAFDGPMEGHEDDMPWHYDLHVWVWQANPAGMFAEFNPNLGCGG
jgi:hypothetical protein